MHSTGDRSCTGSVSTVPTYCVTESAKLSEFESFMLDIQVFWRQREEKTQLQAQDLSN
jgi:hypothetical protein